MRCRKAYLLAGPGRGKEAELVKKLLECIGVDVVIWDRPGWENAFTLQLCGLRVAGNRVLSVLAWLYGRRLLECLVSIGEEGLAEQLWTIAAAGDATRSMVVPRGSEYAKNDEDRGD